MVDGVRYSKVFGSQQAAETYRASLVMDRLEGKVLHDGTLGAVVAAWREHIDATKDTSTAQHYQYSLQPFEKLLDRSLDKVRTIDLQAILDNLTGRKAQLAHDKLRQCIRWAVRKQLARDDITEGLDRPKHERATVEVFTIEEVAAILQASQKSPYHAAIRLALSCGLRGGELWGLQWSDLHGHELTIQRQAAERAGTITVKPPKANSVRTIALPDSVVEAISHIDRPSLRITDSWMFPNSRGNITRRSNFSARVWRKLLDECDIRPRGFHHCRHTAASMMLNNGVPITTVAKVLGHKDAATTLGIYAHMMTTDLAAHRNRFDDVLGA